MKKALRNLVVILVLLAMMGSVVMFCTPGSACSSLQSKCGTDSDFIQKTCEKLFENATQGEINCIQQITNCERIIIELPACAGK